MANDPKFQSQHWDLIFDTIQTVEEVIPKDAIGPALENLGRAVADKCPRDWNLVTDLPSGRRHVHVSITPVIQNNVCYAIVGSAHDVTEYKEAEERARRALADLERTSSIQQRRNCHAVSSHQGELEATSTDQLLETEIAEFQSGGVAIKDAALEIQKGSLLPANFGKSPRIARTDFSDTQPC